jgi:hypothetical protein
MSSFEGNLEDGMETGNTPAAGACDHAQPNDVARMGEEFLRAKNVPETGWDGCRFGYGGNGGTGPFKSVYTEVERRAGNWVAVKLDRRKDDLPPERTGFQIIQLSESAAALNRP